MSSLCVLSFIDQHSEHLLRGLKALDGEGASGPSRLPLQLVPSWQEPGSLNCLRQIPSRSLFLSDERIAKPWAAIVSVSPNFPQSVSKNTQYMTQNLAHESRVQRGGLVSCSLHGRKLVGTKYLVAHLPLSCSLCVKRQHAETPPASDCNFAFVGYHTDSRSMGTTHPVSPCCRSTVGSQRAEIDKEGPFVTGGEIWRYIKHETCRGWQNGGGSALTTCLPDPFC
jgi:hypothetical protein